MVQANQKHVPGGIRTPNLLIRSQKLYPVELQALWNLRFFDFRFPIGQKRLSISLCKSKIGTRKSKIRWVADGTRTRNNQNHNLGLYH
jgi:hypothetical protein